jgi:hypothetical protein
VRAKGVGHFFWITVIDSRAPPRFNKWSSWAEDYMRRIADEVRKKLDTD